MIWHSQTLGPGKRVTALVLSQSGESLPLMECSRNSNGAILLDVMKSGAHPRKVYCLNAHLQIYLPVALEDEHRGLYAWAKIPF